MWTPENTWREVHASLQTDLMNKTTKNYFKKTNINAMEEEYD